MHWTLSLATTILALAAMWASGYFTGQTRERRRAAAKHRHPANQPATVDVPDTPAALDDGPSHCDCDDRDLPPEVERTAAFLAESSKTGMAILDRLGAAPAAVLIVIPDTSCQSHPLTLSVIHPDAFPDSALLADELADYAARIRRRQGQINEDLHHIRRGDRS